MTQLLGAILRGLRARALLTSGSVLLTALAIGSAILWAGELSKLVLRALAGRAERR